MQSKSQLSYRKMTPKASPLPPSLQMTRGEKQVRTADSPTSLKSGQGTPKSHRSSEKSTKSATPRSENSARSQVSQKSQRSVASRKSDRSKTLTPQASEAGSHKTATPHDTPRGSAPGTPLSSRSRDSRRSTRSRDSYKSADKTFESAHEETTATEEEQTTARSTEGESVAEDTPRQEEGKEVDRPSSHSSGKHSSVKAGETTPASARSYASNRSKKSTTKDD